MLSAAGRLNDWPRRRLGVELEAARLLLARLGITPEQLLAGAARRDVSVPTFTEYLDRVSQAVSAGTRRVYDTYWRRVREVWGDRRLDEPTPLEIKQLAERMKVTAVTRSNSRGGRTVANTWSPPSGASTSTPSRTD